MEEQMTLMTADKLTCAFCKKTFNKPSNVKRHVRLVHKITSTNIVPTNIKCHDCRETKYFSSIRCLRDHLKSEHKHEIAEEHVTFSSFHDFLLWKKKLEKETNSRYVRSTSHKQNGKLFVCHRSGLFKKTGTGHRAPKSQGSCKLGYYCTSSISVVEDGSGVIATFVPQHYGHLKEIQHLTLHKDEKDVIASQILAGVESQRILDDVRDDFSGEDLERIHLLTRQDISNINRSYNLVKNSLGDKSSVKLWVDSQKENSINPILFFKQQGKDDENGIFADDDFILAIMTNGQKEIFKKFGEFAVCVDSTHGTNESDFQVTTIMVVDEFGTGVPVAFCISNKVDAETVECFFSAVSLKLGIIKTRCFLTDDVSTYVNAWTTVMGPSNHYLCMWHVERAFRNQLCKIASHSKKSLVYKTLKIVMEHNNKDTFPELMKSFVKKCLADKDTEDYGKYFVTYYASRPEKWACCYRDGNLTTNNHLESFHRVLKHVYFNGTQNKHIEKLVAILLKIMRNLCFERLIKHKKGKPTKRRRITLKRHNEGKLISSNKVTEATETSWHVQSADNIYCVFLYEQSCSENCQLKCIACNVCVHKFGCECIDHTVHTNMCKHIHSVVLKLKQSGVIQETPNIIVDDDNTIKSLVEITEVRKKQATKKTIMDEVINSTKVLLANLEQNRENVNTEDASNLLKLINKANRLSSVKNVKKQNTPWNKKIKRQEMYTSTIKRRKKTTLSLKNPTLMEKKYLLESLNDTTDKSEVIHTDFDHVY